MMMPGVRRSPQSHDRAICRLAREKRTRAGGVRKYGGGEYGEESVGQAVVGGLGARRSRRGGVNRLQGLLCNPYTPEY